ncbi:hypothetical protein KUCAC02_002672, partial [Chaenocephalus aceratus]
QQRVQTEDDGTSAKRPGGVPQPLTLPERNPAPQKHAKTDPIFPRLGHAVSLPHNLSIGLEQGRAVSRPICLPQRPPGRVTCRFKRGHLCWCH